MPDLEASEESNDLILLNARCIALLTDGGPVDLSLFTEDRSDGFTMIDRLRAGGFQFEEKRNNTSSTSYEYSSSDGTIKVTIFFLGLTL